MGLRVACILACQLRRHASEFVVKRHILWSAPLRADNCCGARLLPGEGHAPLTYCRIPRRMLCLTFVDRQKAARGWAAVGEGTIGRNRRRVKCQFDVLFGSTCCPSTTFRRLYGDRSRQTRWQYGAVIAGKGRLAPVDHEGQGSSVLGRRVRRKQWFRSTEVKNHVSPLRTE